MLKIVIRTAVLLLFLSSQAVAQTSPVRLRAQADPAASQQGAAKPDGDLFLFQDDIARVQRVLPGLVEASHKGRADTLAFLAKQETSPRRLRQLLMNLSVTYTDIVLNEQFKELQAQLEAKPGDYNRLLDESRRQLDEITSAYKKAQRNGRSALQVNREVVASNRTAVEGIMTLLRDVEIASLPPELGGGSSTPKNQ